MLGTPESAAQPTMQDTTTADTSVWNATEFEPGSPSYEYLASRGFYRRRAEGAGWFVTRREPAFARSNWIGDILRAAPGVSVVERDGQTLVFSGRSARACLLAIFSDGVYTSSRDLGSFAADDILALEVYRGAAGLPVEFRPTRFDRRCGALLIWSRVTLDD